VVERGEIHPLVDYFHNAEAVPMLDNEARPEQRI